MKKLMQSVTAILVAFAMVSAPVMDAQTRGRNGQNASRPTTGSSPAAQHRPSSQGHQQRPSSGQQRPSATPSGRPNHGVSGANQNRPANNGNYRPGNSGNHNRPGNGPQKPQTPTPPGNNGNHNRPGGNNPGHNRPEHNRPGNPPSANHRPGGQYRPDNHRPPQHQHRPPQRPPHRHDYGYRHHVPFFGAFHRPVPPPRWHYSSGGPVFGTILGVALGTAIGASLTALANNGYTVSSYGNDVVYLTNVPQMNYYWPDAAMYYNNGALYASQFTYASPYYDMSRFNNLYGTFTSQYGAPVEYLTQNGITRASWYGASNRFVTLTFGLNSGSYYTTLSFGN